MILSSLKARIRNFISHAVAQSITNAEKPSAQRLCVYMGNERALTETIYGHKMYVKTTDLSLAPHILLDGFWENWITKVFIREVSTGMVVIDIGANIGYYSLLASEAVGPGGMVYCFDANPDVNEILFQNLEINGFLSRSKVINKAVFSETIELELSVCGKHQGGSSIYLDESSVEIYHDSFTKIKVPAISLDDYFPEGTKVDFIKVDAEGAEPDIIKGASRLLNENKDIKILMEWNPVMLNRPGKSLHEFYTSLQSYGFYAFRIAHDSSLVLETFEELSSVSHCDILLKRHN